MAGKNKKDVVSIQKYKRKGNWNIGIVLFGVIFIYLVFTVLIYFTKDRINVYEVREGSILKDRSFTGIVLRQESVIKADQAGYVNYFVDDAQKVANGSNIYTVTSSPLETQNEQDSNEEVALSSEEWNSILLKAQAFNESYYPGEFKTASNLKTEVTGIVQNNTTQSRVAQLNSILDAGNTDGLQVVQSQDDGVVELSVDGYENLQLGDITDDTLTKANHSVTELESNQYVEAGNPVYRLITSEDWTVTIKLTSELEKTFLEKMNGKDSLSVEVRFLKDNKDLWGTLQILKKGKDEAYAYISFNSSMIRYAGERFVNIELILEDESGLKIPKSSVTEKECFEVPMDYLTSGGASQNIGVYRQITKKGKTTTEFVPVTVINKDTESGTAYLSMDDLKKGDVLLLPESSETTTVDKTAKLKGVYNVNKGYAVFKQVQILCESDEYYIIKEGSSYSLSNYDHIALNGDSVQDNAIVSQ